MQKKILGIMLVLCMLFSVLMVMPASAAEAIEITTAEQILKLMNGDAEYPLTGNYVLKNDIDLSTYTGSLTQKPIGTGTGTNRFFGTFDGGTFTISGLNISTTAAGTGLFGNAGSGAVIKNLTVSGTVTSTANATGGLIGYASRNLTVENCILNVTVSGNARTAGIIGCYDGAEEGATLTISNCSNTGAITGSDTQAGGIVGRILDGAADVSVSITDCSNSGKIESLNYMGGIASHIEFKQSGSSATLESCTNSAVVTSLAPASKGDNGGGMVSFIKLTGSGTKIELLECKNTGDVFAFQYGGGMLGQASLASANGDATLLVKDCLNQGAVSSKSFLGGIAGRINADGASAAPTGKIELLNCKNEGEVTIGVANSYAFVGGIIGFASITDEPLRISECINTGTINGNTAGSDGAGGIAGNLRNYKETANGIVVEDCYNNGDVVSVATTAGGIVGATNKTGGSGISNIRSCVNNALVSIGGSAGAGIIGDDSGADATALGTCYNVDDTVQDMTGLNSAFWVIGTMRSEPKALHTTHYYEPTTTDKHNCPCGEVAEGTCNYVDYVCDVCGVDQPVIELTITVDSKLCVVPGIEYCDLIGKIPGADVQVDFDKIVVTKEGDNWVASNLELVGADKDHYELASTTTILTDLNPDYFVTVTADGVSEVVYRGQSFTAVAEEAPEGYEYLGWYLGDSCWTTEYVLEVPSVWGDLTFTSKYESNTPTPPVGPVETNSRHNNAVAAIAIAMRNQRTTKVTFKSNGAKLYNVQTVKANGILVLPEAPTKDGYIFAGWYKDINGTKPVDFTGKLSGDITLYAKWVKA